MRPNPQETADLVAFTEEILNGKLHFLFNARSHYLLQMRHHYKKTASVKQTKTEEALPTDLKQTLNLIGLLY